MIFVRVASDKARKSFESLLITLVDGQHIRQCSLGLVTEITAAFQTVEAVVRTKDIVLTPISFRCFRVVEPGEDFVAIWIPVGLSSGWSL